MSTMKISTNGMYRSYRDNLEVTQVKMQKSMQQVSTGRTFNTYAEDPAAAGKAFQLRRTFWRTSDSIDSSNHLISKFDTAYQAAASIVDGDVENPGLNGLSASLRALTTTAATARSALGSEMIGEANSAMQILNSQYGNEYVFAGADGLHVPFEWQENEDGSFALLYRGVDVSAAEGTADRELLDKYIRQDKSTYANIGLGLEFTSTGLSTSVVDDEAEGVKDLYNQQLVISSAAPSSISGAEFSGFGVDEDGDSQNVIVLMRELGEIFQRCNEGDGAYASTEDEDRAGVLQKKLRDAIGRVQQQHVVLSANVTYLKTNLTQLENSNYAVNEEISELEQADPALAITEMMWATYCYQAALRVGNDILTESLFDYMR